MTNESPPVETELAVVLCTNSSPVVILMMLPPGEPVVPRSTVPPVIEMAAWPPALEPSIVLLRITSEPPLTKIVGALVLFCARDVVQGQIAAVESESRRPSQE